jgi:hypothetical protein
MVTGMVALPTAMAGMVALPIATATTRVCMATIDPTSTEWPRVYHRTTKQMAKVIAHRSIAAEGALDDSDFLLPRVNRENDVDLSGG